MESASEKYERTTPDISSTFALNCQRSAKRKFARLKITTKALLLELPEAVDEETENRYRNISAGLLLKCQKVGIPGTLYGTFRGRYDSVVLKHQGTAYMNYFNRDLYKQDAEEFQAKVDQSADEMRARGYKFEGDEQQPQVEIIRAMPDNRLLGALVKP
jgi:hypothetical protein